ncbi:glycerophosphoryl diester phosphodiesterase membrane domain-containing protein [Sphingomonas sp. IC-56]|uniref:glycerophosphoryl diester phosphodiesterase membrane domain-containing protein n=1 Tax=Sphingomonas sp. IC-56 TaxID=2898529 RepID=UPI001E6279CA|nr:glycerophosphoryl diester phosphodiesterase membrane domain-containing protein [Sphingomonas sp. IC-56]MCD2324705.1 glycerophosphoryl diester phosphodiesterase membrane domain-containing protein [Sphingomonas sp. IC-56]
MVKMGTVWDRTAEFLGDNVAAILPVALIAFFVPASIQGSLSALQPRDGTMLGLLLGLLQLGFAVLSLWGTLAITAMGLDLVSDRSAGRVALSRLPATLGVSVLLLLAALVLASPIAIAIGLSGQDLMALSVEQPLNMSAGVAAFAGIYMLVLLGAFLWFGARLLVVTPTIVRERRALSAVKRSWQLTRGHGFRILGVLILYVVVSWVAQLAAQVVFGSVFELVAGGSGEGLSLADVLTSIVVAAVQSGFSVVLAGFTAKLYLALAARSGAHGDPAGLA